VNLVAIAVRDHDQGSFIGARPRFDWYPNTGLKWLAARAAPPLTVLKPDHRKTPANPNLGAGI
jgi:hypothetical protein